MNSIASATVPSEWIQRASNSAPITRPVVASISGWKKGRMSPLSMARRSDCSAEEVRSSSSCISRSNTWSRLRPSRFALNNAVLALRSRSLAVVPCSGEAATPMLTDDGMARPSACTG